MFAIFQCNYKINVFPNMYYYVNLNVNIFKIINEILIYKIKLLIITFQRNHRELTN